MRTLRGIVPGRARLSAGLAALMLAVSGCGFGVTGLAFHQDDRLTILTPKEREKVRLPVTLTWRVEDFAVTAPGAAGRINGDAGYFAIFVDRSPVPPGKTLAHVARDDNSCRPADGCPDAAYLSARGIYTTTKTSYVLETLPQTAKEGRREFHEVTVVLLRPDGRRLGESAWHVRFELDRKVAP
jgi:hypothetical protein